MNTVHSPPDDLEVATFSDVGCCTESNVDVNVGIVPAMLGDGVVSPVIGVGDNSPNVTVGDGVPDIIIGVGEIGDSVEVNEVEAFVGVIEPGIEVRLGVGVGGSITGVLLSTGLFVGITG